MRASFWMVWQGEAVYEICGKSDGKVGQDVFLIFRNEGDFSELLHSMVIMSLS